MRISVELIPRGKEQITSDAMSVREALPVANAFNVPDLTQLPLRSWEACAITRSILPASIPHIRAIDIAPDKELDIGQAIVDAGLSEVLVIKGDSHHDMSRRIYPNTSESVIHRFKREFPALQVYAAFDPYRLGFRDEMDGVARKLDAGADGFFTQPIFDSRLLELCADMLQGLCVFWGLAPVIGLRSKAYWEATNRVIFPSTFEPTMEWNHCFANAALCLIRAHGGNVYFMPIRVNLRRYLEGLVCNVRCLG